MVYDRDPDQDLSNRPPSAKHTPWELSTLVIGLIVILTGGYLIVQALHPPRPQDSSASRRRRFGLCHLNRGLTPEIPLRPAAGGDAGGFDGTGGKTMA